MAPNQILHWSLLASLAAFVFWRGSAPERLAMAAWVVNSILSFGPIKSGLGAFETLQVGVFIIDVATLIFLVWLSLKADRFWLLWMTGFHLWGICARIAISLVPSLNPTAYAIGQAVGGYAILATMLAGTIQHRKRLRAHESDSSWSSSSVR